MEVTINRLAANMKMNPKETMKMGPIPVKCAEFGSIFRTHHMFASAHRVIYLEDAELKVVSLCRFEVVGSGPSGTAKSVSVRCNKCVPICYVGSQAVSRLFVSSLFLKDSG